MKKILVTRRLLRSCEDKAKEIFDANLNLNDELYSQKKLIEMSEGCDGILSALTDKLDADTINKLPDSVKILSNFAKLESILTESGNLLIVSASSLSVKADSIPSQPSLISINFFCEYSSSLRFKFANLNLNDELYSQKKLIEMSEGCDGILSALTDKLDADTINKLPDSVKILSNFAKLESILTESGNLLIVSASSLSVKADSIPSQPSLISINFFCEYSSSLRFKFASKISFALSSQDLNNLLVTNIFFIKLD